MFKTPGLFLLIVTISSITGVFGSASIFANSLRVQLQYQGQPQITEGAVVWLQTAAPLDRSLDQDNAPTPVHTIEQRNRQFAPYISVARLGSNIQFPNRDNTAHHVYSFSEPLSFELPLYKHRTPAPISVEKTGLIALGCNIHDWMIAYLVVVDSPYFAQVDKDFVLFSEVPAGEYTLMFWHPDINNGKAIEQKLDYQGQAQHTVNLTHKVNINAQPDAPKKRFDEDEDY